MYGLQTTVVVRDKEFHIRNNGDYRMVIDCFKALQDEDLGEDYRILASLLIFYNEFCTYEDITNNQEYVEELITEMYRFMNCGQDNDIGAKQDTKLFDWEDDSVMICAAINNVANTEIRALPYLHWWTFMGYYMSIGESVFSTVISIRDKIAHGKKLENWEKDFRLHNPKYFTHKQTKEEKQILSDVMAIWHKEG